MELWGFGVAFVVAGWMAYDSSQNQIPLNGNSGDSAAFWFLMGFLLLIVFFPFYLFRRSQVLNARARDAAYKRSQPTVLVRPEPPMSQADEILKFKGLLDAGAISQEEYDVKKRKLLGM